MRTASFLAHDLKNVLRRLLGWIGLLLLLGHGPVVLSEIPATHQTPIWVQAREAITAQARAEVESGHLTGVAIVWVDGQDIVFNQGFGIADPRRRRVVDEQTVFRVGSISKLFNAVAVMQQVERGNLDLDAPVTRYLPEFHLINPYSDSEQVTLRQLLCHRSGMVRESPVGNYFDPSEPGTQRTAESLAGCPLVHPPNTKTKYSNSGVTLSGWAVESVSGIPYARYQAQEILEPLGMKNAAFLLDNRLRKNLARGQLPVATLDGGFRRIDAPQFEFGILPAGNLYATAADLARFVQCLFQEGRTASGALIQPDTLAEMMKVQLTDQSNGFGLGFSLGTHQGLRTFGHMGAVYGFTSALLAVPEHQVAAIVLANDDIAIGAVRRLTTLSMDKLLESKSGLKPTEETVSPLDLTGLPIAYLKQFEGEYESQSYWANLREVEGRIQAVISRQPMVFTPVQSKNDTPTFEARGRLSPGSSVVFQVRSEDSTSVAGAGASAGEVLGFTWMNQTFRRVPTGEPPPIPPAWESYLGRYGPNFIPLIVSVRNGHLYAMIENEFDNRLTPLTDNVFQLPPGMYVDEHLVFHPDRRGRINRISLGTIPLLRQRP